VLAWLLAACAHRPLAIQPPPADDLVYFAMVDRFADGDPHTPGDNDRADPAAFHGGDLKGVVKHLDYLQDLGVKTLWISPVFAMRDDKLDGHGAFHGYWTTDPARIEPRFGTTRDLIRLRRALSRRDMRLVLDMVWNHVGNDAPLTEARPEWFHGQGDVVNWEDPDERVTHDVHGLPDLAQEDEAVYRWLRDHALSWVNTAQPDGLRIDAVKHMPLTFQARIAEDLRAHSDPDLWMLGEAFEGDPSKLAQILAGGGFSAVFDFPLHYAMLDVYCKDQPLGRLASVLSQDLDYGPLLRENPHALVTFLDNHDTARVLTTCGGDVHRVEQALFFQLLSRGTPSVTWGTEIGAQGAQDPENRPDMRFDAPNSVGGTLRWAAGLRREHPALTEGATLGLALEGDRYLVLRVSPDEAALIAVNRGKADLSLGLPRLLKDVARPTSGVLLGADGVPHTLPSPVDPDEPVPVPGLGTTVVFWKPLQTGGLKPLIDAAWSPPPRPVTLTAHAPLGEGDTLLWVGASPALGAWDPARAVPVDAEGHATIQAPISSVLASKLVIRHPDGSLTWEQGEDRYVFVTPGNGPLAVTAGWRGD